MGKELMTLSFSLFSPTNFEFKLACEHGSCDSLRNILFSTVTLVFIFMCFVFAFCLKYYITGFMYGLKYKGDEKTSIHLDSTDKSIPKTNGQLSSAKCRQNSRNSVSKEPDHVRGLHNVIVGEVQRHPRVTNPVPVQHSQIKSHSNEDIRKIGHRGYRNPNRFQTREAEFVTCSSVKDRLTTDADSPVITIPNNKTVVREGCRAQRKLTISHPRAADLAPYTDAKLILPSNADSLDNFKSTGKTDVRGGPKRQRKQNRFDILAAAPAPCTDAKLCVPSNTDSPTSFVSNHKTDVRKGCKRQRYSLRRHTKAVPCNDAKLVLPSPDDSSGRTISRDKRDVHGEELQEEEEIEISSDYTGNEEVDGDIQTYSDCINDPYGDSAYFFLEESTASDLETDAIPSDKPTKKDDTEDNGPIAVMEQGICFQDRVIKLKAKSQSIKNQSQSAKGRCAYSQQNIRKNKTFQMRKTKRSTHSSAKRSGETIIKGENIMIGKHNTMIITEDCKCSRKMDDIKQTLDGFSSRIFEILIKFDPLMQEFDGLSAIVFELSRKLNCLYAERDLVAVPRNYVQNVASGTSKFRHSYACCCNKTSAKGINDPYGDSACFFVEASTSSDLETDAISSNKPTKKDDTENNDPNSDMEQGNCSQDGGRRARSQQNKTFQMRKTKMSSHSSAKRSGETVIKGETIMMGKHNTLLSTEDCKGSMKVDDLKQMLDGLSATTCENSM